MRFPGIIIVGALLQIRQPTGNFFIDTLALWQSWWQASTSLVVSV